MTYLLDTCLISELVAKQPNQKVLDWLDAQASETLYLSVITMGEIAKGISKLAASQRKEDLDIWLKQTLPIRFSGRIIGIDLSTMLLWGELVGKLEKQGRPLPMMDSLIAAIAFQNSLALVTRNEKDFVGIEVVIVNPWTIYSKYRSNPPQNNLSKRLKADATMMKPIKSILISNSINSHSNSCIKSINCTSFSRANNFFQL